MIVVALPPPTPPTPTPTPRGATSSTSSPSSSLSGTPCSVSEAGGGVELPSSAPRVDVDGALASVAPPAISNPSISFTSRGVSGERRAFATSPAKTPGAHFSRRSRPPAGPIATEDGTGSYASPRPESAIS
eukprot:31003-Pelagococcus_subviridis.AAC.7